jgi:hypothetical protein
MRDEMPRPSSGGGLRKRGASFELQTLSEPCNRRLLRMAKICSTEVKWVSAEGGWTEIALDVKTWASNFSQDSNQSGAIRVGSILRRYHGSQLWTQDDP